MSIDKLTDVMSNFELDPLTGINPKYLFGEFITRIKNTSLIRKYNKLDARWKLKFEGAFLNLYREFDMSIVNNRMYIAALFHLVDSLDTDMIDGAAKTLRILSIVDPISLNTLNILFQNCDCFGIASVDKLREDQYIDDMGMMTLKNCGLISNFDPGAVLGGGSEEVTISHDGYRILKLNKYKTNFPYNLKCFNHRYEYELNEDYKPINMNDLWKEYLRLYDIALQMKRYKDDDLKIQIDGLEGRTTRKETEDNIMLILTKLFERDDLIENALEYLFVFREDNIGLDIIWRSLRDMYDKLSQYIYIRDNLPNKEKSINWEDIKGRMKFNISKINIMKTKKDKNQSFYYEWH